MRRPLLFLILLACEIVHANGPEFFVNMADPQMGMYTKNQDTLQEQANLTFVVASINRLKPAFVVVCGDLVNRAGDAEQIRQYKRIMHELDPHLHISTAIRRSYLDVFHRYGVAHAFSGHYHRNAFGRDQEIEMITTGAVGVPMGGSQSGFRIVRLGPTVESRYYDLGAIP